MPKLNYKCSCRKLIADVPYPDDLEPLRYRPAMAGAELSVGLCPVRRDQDGLQVRDRNGGRVFKVRIEKRKPPEAIVQGMSARRIREVKTTLTNEQVQAIYDQVKAELWNSTPSKVKDVFVKIHDREVYIFSDSGTADKVTAFLRTSFGTFANDRRWDGAAFSDMVIDHLLNDASIGHATLEDTVSYERTCDRSHVSISDAPDLYSVAFSKILSAADRVSGVGLRPATTGQFVTVTSDGIIAGTLDIMQGNDSNDDDEYADYLIYEQQACAVACELVEITEPYVKHEEVEDDESED